MARERKKVAALNKAPDGGAPDVRVATSSTTPLPNPPHVPNLGINSII